LLVLLPLTALIAAGLWVTWTWRKPPRRRSETVTPYRNARPGVAYVGDAACTPCHAEIAATYRQHPMGRSAIAIEAAPADIRGDESARTLFTAQGYEYAVERRDGRTFHRETRRDEQGRTIGDVEGEVRYVIGSGTRALAFLIDRDGYLFESPITWYSQQKRWDLSPGYEQMNAHFERPIPSDCLFCHANQINHVAGTVNRYREPAIRGHAIGCERCHGPGELHAREPTPSPGNGPNIVNPRNLEPKLRDAVCQQCHLIGQNNITKAGRNLFDYRPGLPFYEFEDVLVRPADSSHDNPNANHFEQLRESRCFKESRGALGCISCHDPHELPAPAEKLSYYRDRCLTCHEKRGCSVPVAIRLAQNPDDNCVACHMPRAALSDIPHVATTIHRIPRNAKPPKGNVAAHPAQATDAPNLVPFDQDAMDSAQRENAQRDLGIALGVQGAAQAFPLLERAVANDPDDLQARESLGSALGALGRGEEGLAALEAVLRKAPERESTLVAAAFLATRLGRSEQAIGYCRRVIAVDPWRSDYHAMLAHQLTAAGHFAEAAESCRRALSLNPANVSARTDLIAVSFRLGAPQQARAEFETLLQFDPPDRDGLMRWFASQR
jgi:Flp pilus assembly protein TadD